MKNRLIILIIFTLVACKQSDETSSSALAEVPIAKKTIEKQALTDNAKALELVYKDLNNNEHKLSDYKGKWVVVNFWATWCTPCRKEMPDFVKFKENFKDKVEIWGIDYEDSDIETIKSFVKDFKINYPILTADVYNPTEFERANTLGLPTTVFFNPQGKQHDKRVGPIHYEDLVKITGLSEE